MILIEIMQIYIKKQEIENLFESHMSKINKL